jgi:putrescine transport system substrate-binding protein
MWGTTGIGYNVDKVKAAFGNTDGRHSWDAGVQAGEHRQAEGLRRHLAGHAVGNDPDRAELPGRRPNSFDRP